MRTSTSKSLSKPSDRRLLSHLCVQYLIINLGIVKSRTDCAVSEILCTYTYTLPSMLNGTVYLPNNLSSGSPNFSLPSRGLLIFKSSDVTTRENLWNADVGFALSVHPDRVRAFGPHGGEASGGQSTSRKLGQRRLQKEKPLSHLLKNALVLCRRSEVWEVSTMFFLTKLN